MGATAVRHTAQVLEHAEMIVAIEMLSAAQGIDLRRRDLEGNPKMGQGTQVAYDLIREKVPFLEGDTVLSVHMEAVRKLVADGTIKRAVEAELGMA